MNILMVGKLGRDQKLLYTASRRPLPVGSGAWIVQRLEGPIHSLSEFPPSHSG